MAGRRGPSPKPDQVKRLEGNAGNRPLKGTADAPEVAIPPCPAIVAEDSLALQFWREQTHELKRLRLIAVINAPVLTAMCVHYARWLRAEQKLRKLESEVDETPNGYLQQNPWLAIANKAHEQFMKAAQEFGMTPASFSRVVAQTGGQLPLPLGDNEEDEFDRFVAARPATPAGEPRTH